MLHRRAYKKDPNIRVLLLSPWPSGTLPFHKSVAYLHSRYGSINIEAIKLPGAEQHFFRLQITSCEQDVRVLLPTGFRGVICVDRYKEVRIKYCTDMWARIKADLIRLDATDPASNENEVYIHSPGKVELEMMDEANLHRDPAVWYNDENGMPRASCVSRIAGKGTKRQGA